ncbi:phage major capsid protein [Streptomyces sp. NPDC056161]|uniref:phage major capsid protein n=1 Tax=Streptomyces sp. NPDC056161 TaxID=3345732 RepID=UPI0035DA8F44
MRDATLGAARKLKDLQGQYLWQPSIQVEAGRPGLAAQVAERNLHVPAVIAHRGRIQAATGRG